MESRPTRVELSAHQGSRRAHSILVWSSRLLVVAGGLALVAFGVVYVRAQLFQRYLQVHFLKDTDVPGASWTLEPSAAWFFSQTSSTAEAPSVTSVVRPSGATPLSAGAPPLPATVGKINIPSVGLEAVVLEGDDARTLRLGVGHIPGTAAPGAPGNVGLAGHRDTFFRPLRKIKVGDEIQFSTKAGTFFYRVTSLRVVPPDAIEVLDSTQRPTLTLVTCYPFYYIGAAPKRFIVHAEMVPVPPRG
jgi:sortase A